MKNISSKLRLIPLFLVLLYVVVTSLYEFSFGVKLAFLGILLLGSSASVTYLYKKGLISKQRIIVFLVFMGISIALGLVTYFYTTEL